MKNLFKKNNRDERTPLIEYLEPQDTNYDILIPWKNSFSGTSFNKWLKEHYVVFQNEAVQDDPNVFFFRTNSTFAFRVHTEILDVEPWEVWNYWKDEILDLGYKIQNSVKEEKGNKTFLRYYFKPLLKFKVEKQQLYGNITLELIKESARFKYIAMKCTWYVDKNFKQAKHYEGLMNVLTY